VRRAGSLDALLPLLRDGDLRHDGKWFCGSEVKPAGKMPLSWLKNADVLDVANDSVLVSFPAMDGLPTEPDLWLHRIVGIEVKEAALANLVAARRSGVGRPREHDWEGAKRYAEEDFAAHGLFPVKARLVDSMERYFRDVRHEKLPSWDTIDRWLRNEPQRTWAEKLISPD
jgi:hypothetical protein